MRLTVIDLAKIIRKKSTLRPLGDMYEIFGDHRCALIVVELVTTGK